MRLQTAAAQRTATLSASDVERIKVRMDQVVRDLGTTLNSDTDRFNDNAGSPSAAERQVDVWKTADDLQQVLTLLEVISRGHRSPTPDEVQERMANETDLLRFRWP